MIGLRDTATLALTKLRTRKVRLFITVFVSGLLFTGLVSASMIARGAFRSIEDFSNEGFSNRYIMTGMSQTSPYSLTQDESVMARAMAIHADTVARKKVEAKRLGTTYDPVTDMPPVEEYDTGAGKQRSLAFNHPAAMQALAEHAAANPGPGMEEFKKLAGGYGVNTFYESRMRPMSGDGSSLQVLKDGKEKFSASMDKMGMPDGFDSFLYNWSAMSGDLLKTFILPDQSLDKASDGSIPVVIPVDAAEQLLGLTALPASAKPTERLERIKEIRNKAGTLQVEICYRNNTSAGLVSSAQGTIQEIEQNKNNKDYVRPELIYGLPTEACGSVPVTRDVRNAETKRMALKQEEFERIFGKDPAEQHKLKFRVVGVVPGFDFGAATSLTQIISSLLTSSLGSGWYMPVEYLDSDPVLAKVFAGEEGALNPDNTYYGEFSDATKARAFLDNENCEPDYSAGMDMGKQCIEQGKPFFISAFGSNSLGLESAKRGFGKIFGYGALAVALVAAIIMMGTVGRMIADSRRETAVFRAIGAKRLDIAQIYILYTILLSLLICVFAVLVGSIIASYVHGRFSDEPTVQALVAYNAQDLSRVFNLRMFYTRDLVYLLALTLAAGIVSSAIPLLRNLRRNPIRDMRDDT